MTDRVIRIGTRSSELALWQANEVARQLGELGVETEIVKIESDGDLVLDKPLYELGITGVFTKNLDVALLKEKIDIAVHSLKDVPTILPEGIVQAAVLKRAGSIDVLVPRTDSEEFMSQKEGLVATGSLRRKAQWLHRYPHHTIAGLRGNVQTRMNKLKESDWDGAIFAQAGLKRVKLLPKNNIPLDWMIPAPAQGVVMIAALEKDQELLEVVENINHKETQVCAHIERQFLNTLEGGCTAPIGALAFIKDEKIVFKGALFSLDGSKKIEMDKVAGLDAYRTLGKLCAEDVLGRGGKKLMKEIAGGYIKKASILSTKQLSNEQTEMLSAAYDVQMSDFIATRFNRLKPAVKNKSYKNVVFTSQNAVESLLNSFSRTELDIENIFCVGRRTKRLIERKFGKGSVSLVENSAADLANKIVEQGQVSEVTFFCGDIRRDELKTILTDNNIVVEEVEVYRTLLNERPFKQEFDGVLFYSPSGVESFLNSNEAKEDTVAFCIGDTTASEAKKYFAKVEVAAMPSVESVLKTVKNYYE